MNSALIMLSLMPRFHKILSILVISLLIVGIFPFQSDAAVATWQEGANIVPNSPTDLKSSATKKSLRDLRATGATHVTFIVPYYQDTPTSSTFHTGWNTPTDDSLTAAIRYAHSLGFSVMITPHIDIETGEWRATINPTSRATWTATYNNLLLHYAQLAERENVEQFCIGSELIMLSSPKHSEKNTKLWQMFITNVRSVYSGKLTYSANWGGYDFGEEAEQIQFWDELDYIGISAYYSLASDIPGIPSAEQLSFSWEDWHTQKIQPLAKKYDKKVLFTEIGYRSTSNAHTKPWDYSPGGHVSEQEQAALYEGIFTYWNTQSELAGIFIWNWETNAERAGSYNTWYTPQNKLAESVLIQWFSTKQASLEPTNISSAWWRQLWIALRTRFFQVKEVQYISYLFE
jgi:hypothetical protein